MKIKSLIYYKILSINHTKAHDPYTSIHFNQANTAILNDMEIFFFYIHPLPQIRFDLAMFFFFSLSVECRFGLSKGLFNTICYFFFSTIQSMRIHATT